MRYLTREHWRPFEKPNGDFDGVKFERLVSTILPKLYPGEWQQTQYSWDGKKDFYQQSGSEQRWAECKAYKKPLSINVISPTLIMALLNDANVILFFSHSPLNKNACWYLAQFEALTSRMIRVYDDEVLEDLILENPEAQAFFPNFAESMAAGPKQVHSAISTARLSQDPDVQYHTDLILEGDNQNVYLNLLSTFCVDVLIRNCGFGDSLLSGKICIDPKDLIERFWLFNEDVQRENPTASFEIAPGGAHFHRFYFRARRSGRIPAPRITVEFQGGRSELLHLDPIDVSSILAVPLIGQRQHAAVATFREMVSARDKPVFFHIYGQSGTGKSRLLREFRDELLGRGFLVFIFNGEEERNSSFDLFVRKLASTVCRLPALDNVAQPAGSDIGFSNTQNESALLDLLYNHQSRPSQSPDQSIRTVLGLLAAHKVAVIVDNMQFLDTDTIALLNAAISVTADTPARNIWVLGLNSEIATAELSATSLSNRLKALAGERRDTVVALEVEGFTKEDARHYLDQALAGSLPVAPEERFTITHPRTTELMLDRVGTRPLFLEQSLQHAAEKGALELIEGRMSVSDIGKFHAAIEALPSRIQELLKMRWSFLQKNVRPGAETMVRALVEMISLPMPIARILNILREDIQTLVTLGIARITESNEIRFHHRQHFLFFTEYYREADPPFAQQLLDAIEKTGYTSLFPFQHITLRNTLGRLQDEDLRNISHIVRNKSVVGPARLRAAPLLLSIFNGPLTAVDAGTELAVVSSLCQELKRYQELDAAATAYDNARAVRLLRLDRYYQYGDEYYKFVLNHANSFFAVHRDGEALPLLESSLDNIDAFRFRTQKSQTLVRGRILNRLCVALKTVRDLPGAERCAQESLAIAAAIPDMTLVYNNYIDWGYIYHGFSRHNQELMEKWAAASRIFHENIAGTPALEDERASAFLHDSTVALLEKHREEAIAIIEEGIRFSRRTLTPFYEVKLLLLRVIAELAWQGNASPMELMRWVNEAEDCAVASKTQRSHWAVHYTRATLYRMSKNWTAAAQYFFAATHQLEKILTDDRMEDRYLPFFEDMALQMRVSRQTLPETVLNQIQNSQTRRLIESVMTMSDDAFDLWLNRYMPTATFNDGRYNLPVP